MTVEFSCPECDKVYTLPSKLAGKMARCKQCQTVMIVPGMVEAVLNPPEPTPTRVEPPPRPTRKPSSPKRPSRPEPEPEDPFGVEDIAALPPRRNDETPDAISPRKKSKRRRSAWENVPLPDFGHGVLAWCLVMIGLIGLGFWVDDGAYKCAQLMVWLGVLLFAVAIIWFLVTGFLEGVTEGLLLLFVPFYSAYHLFKCWSTTYRPFWTGVGAIVSFLVGTQYYGLFGDDVGDRALLAFPGSAASQRVVIDEQGLPLRPPDIPADLPTEEALARWDAHVEALWEASEPSVRNHVKDLSPLQKLIQRKKKVMTRNHGRGSISTVSVSNIMDGATFDSVANALRKFAGPAPDDFFVYPTAGQQKTGGMVVLLSPAADPRVLLSGIDFGANKISNPRDGSIYVYAATDSVPEQLKSLFESKDDEKTRLANLAGRPAGLPSSRPAQTSPPRTLVSLPESGDLELPYPRCIAIGNTIYPASNSRFVAIGTNQNMGDSRESWDLQERRRIGVIAGQVRLYREIKLSPDGRSMAGVTSDGQAVEVWSFETGALVRRIEANTTVNTVDYVGPDRVLIGTPFQNTHYLTEIVSGRGLKKIVSPVLIDEDSLGVSPDLKSLALASFIQKSAGVYSLETAKLTRNWVVPPGQPYAALVCRGMVYSADGTEVAGLFDDYKYTRFMVWGSEGQLIASSLIPRKTPDSVEKPPLYRGRPLDWLPDKSGWMVYGQAIVDKLTGKLAWSIPSDPDASKSEPRRIMDNGDLLTVSGSNTNPILKSVRLPLDEIARAIQAVR